MTKIIGFKGKKQSGKSTCCNFILMLKLMELGVSERVRLNKHGRVEVTDIYGDRMNGSEWFLFKEPFVNVRSFLNDLEEIKIYSLAKPIKDIGINLLGLSEDLVYGSDEDKNQETDLYWENMPGIHCVPDQKIPFSTYHESGKMKVREVLQYVGTEIFRKMYPDIWIDSCLREIKKDNFKIALIDDVRYDNETKKLKNENAKIIGLKRNYSNKADRHSSEKVTLKGCDFLIDNRKFSIEEQNEELYKVISSFDKDILPKIL